MSKKQIFEFGKYEFLKPEIKPGATQRGSFAVVEKLNLPREILDKVPDGFVIKEYIGGDYSDSRMFYPRDPNLLSPTDKAKILKDRENFVREFFDRYLKGFVVPSDFFVGAGTRFENKPAIYQLQRYVDYYSDIVLRRWCDLNLRWQVNLEHAKVAMRDLPAEHKRRLLLELKVFVGAMGDMPKQKDWPEFTGYTLDIIGNNILFDRSGHLRCFDTNMLLKEMERPVGDLDSLDSFMWNIYHQNMVVLERLVKVIEECNAFYGGAFQPSKETG